jgi:hypothetical protein
MGEAKVAGQLAKWERKEKLAKTKVKKLGCALACPEHE